MCFGSEGVDTSPPVRTAFNNLFAIYDTFQKLLKASAYNGQDKDGRKIKEFSPVLNRVATFDEMKEKF